MDTTAVPQSSTPALTAYPAPPRNGLGTNIRVGWYGVVDWSHERRTPEAGLPQRALWLYRKAEQLDAKIDSVYAANIAAISERFAPRFMEEPAPAPTPPRLPDTGDSRVDAVLDAAQQRAARAQSARADAALASHRTHQAHEADKAIERERLMLVELANAESAHGVVRHWAEALNARYHRSRSGLAGLKRTTADAAIAAYPNHITPAHPLAANKGV